jgi:hypothetical protein
LGKVIKWFIATVIVGLIPMLMRGLVYLFLSGPNTVQPVLISDVIVWGLVLNISIFNERHGHFRYHLSISELSSTLSVFLLLVFAVMFIFTILNEAMILFNQSALFLGGIILDIFTFFSCIIYIFLSCPYLKNRAILDVIPEKEK